VSENARTLAAAAALEQGAVEEVGRLLGASHASLATLYEVSGPALDAAVAVAHDAPGCLGARMTGAGFAGCAVALVRSRFVDEFVETVKQRFVPPAGARPDIFPCVPSPGVGLLSLAEALP